MNTKKAMGIKKAMGTKTAVSARRRVLLGVILALGVVVVLVVGAELALRAVIPSMIAAEVRDKLAVPGETSVRVTVFDEVMLLAVLTGRAGPIEVVAPGVQITDDIHVDVLLRVESLPFDLQEHPLEGARIVARVPSSSMGAIMALATEGLVHDGAVDDGQIEISSDVELFGADVPLSARLAVAVSDGDVLIEPVAVTAAGFTLTAEQLRPLLDPGTARLLDSRTVCVRDRLPAGVTLTAMQLSPAAGGSAQVTASIAGDIFSNPEKQRLGVCG